LPCIASGFTILVFLLVTVGSVRLTPFWYISTNLAYKISYDETPLYKDSQGFVWTDATLGIQHSTTFINASVPATYCYACDNSCTVCNDTYCILCDSNCNYCAPTNVSVKYSAAPIMKVNQVNISETQINGIATCFWFVCRTPLWFENYTDGISVSTWDTDCLGTPSLENCTYECGSVYDDTLVHYVEVLNDVVLSSRPRWFSKYSQATVFANDLRDYFAVNNIVNFQDIYYSFNATLVPAIENATLGTILRNSAGAYLMVYWGDEPFYYYRSGFVVFFLTTYVALISVIPPSPFLFSRYFRPVQIFNLAACPVVGDCLCCTCDFNLLVH